MVKRLRVGYHEEHKAEAVAEREKSHSGEK